MAKRLDLVGQRFGRLTVISLNEEVSKQKKNTYWNCKCDCGNEKVVLGKRLRGGATTSCGCYHREISKEKMREMNIERWQDEEFRQTKSELSSKRLKEKWQDEEFRQMKSDKLKEMWQDEEYRQMQKDIHWKGGITPISIYLRGLLIVEQWFNDSKKQANYTCELTGKVGRVNTHHLKAFSTIVLEAHELHNIQVKQQVKDYTEEELHKLEEYVAGWHEDTSNAVVLCEEAHKLFHSLYGQGGNTPEQFEEFRKRYLNGEFKDLI